MSIPASPGGALPSRRALARASLAFLGLGVFLLLGVVWPAETGKDPLGFGAVTGLTEMGRIKVALARELADSTGARAANASPSTESDTRRSMRANSRASAVSSDAAWRDSVSVRLSPNQGIELKLVMRRDEKANFEWTSDSGEVYFNRHGEPNGAPKDVSPHSYAKGMSRSDSGEIVAVFDGMHGWFFRNRADRVVVVTLRTAGAYELLKTLK